MMNEFALQDLEALSGHIIETSRQGTLAAIAEAPFGTYRSTLMVDGYNDPIRLAATMTIGADGVDLDFSGTSGCSPKDGPPGAMAPCFQ